MDLNSFLLSKFAHPKLQALSHSSYLALRYRILAIIYLNIVLTCLMIMFEIGSRVIIGISRGHALTVVCCVVGAALSLAMVKKGQYDLAGGIILIYVHTVNSITTHLMNIPMAGIFGTFCYVNLAPLLIKSDVILVINGVLSMGELILHVQKLYQIFEVTLTEDQYVQIFSGSVSMFVAYGYMTGLALIQKKIQGNLWNMVQENFQKSEDLTKEVIKTVDTKDRFVSALSHQVRIVLDPLNESIEHLMTIFRNPSYTQLLKNAKMRGEILLHLVENTLAAVRIKGDRFQIMYEETDFEDVMGKALILFAQSLKKKKIFAQTFIDSTLSRKISIDVRRILQIMSNLLSNAIKYTPDNGKIRIDVVWYEEDQKPENLLERIEDDENLLDLNDSSSEIASRSVGQGDFINDINNISEFSKEEDTIRQKNLFTMKRSPVYNLRGSSNPSYAENWHIKRVDHPNKKKTTNRGEKGCLKVQISDTGCGIDESQIPKVFERFASYDRRRPHQNLPWRGGLWLCREICRRMNGDIKCYSSPNKGTTFVFYVMANNPERRLSSEAALRPVRESVNALVVDDYDFNRNLHKLLLEREGVHVTLANDGKEALQKYKAKGNDYFDFILMDINMPVMDGIESALLIREWEEKQKFKPSSVYFLSGDYFHQDQVLGRFRSTIRAENMGKILFMKKPMELKMLSNIVSEHSKNSGHNSSGDNSKEE